MLVNDDPSFIDIVGDALRAEGLAVLLVPGVAQGIRALQAGFRPDAVLVGVRRSQASVGELLRTMERDPGTRAVPVVEASTGSESLLQIAPRGCRQRFATPPDPRALAELLDQLCAADHGEVWAP
jgi:CheY-like chemotaxis protein